MSKVKETQHFWMVYGVVHYKQEGTTDVSIVGANVLAATPEVKFNHTALDKVHREFARRVMKEHKVNPNNITAITLQSINYLGEMTGDEMFGAEPKGE